MAIEAAAPGEMLRIGAVQLKVLAPQESALIPAPWAEVVAGDLVTGTFQAHELKML